jgi:site-specific recombinase XerD
MVHYRKGKLGKISRSSNAVAKRNSFVASAHAPALISACGPKATRRYFEFFTANIRNRNTREAYHRALNDFFAWLDDTNVSLIDIEPVIVAAYVEYLGTIYSKPTVKQHLAAIRMCMDWLVVGQIIPMNPASSVRGPKYVIKRGKTPVLTAEEVEVKEFCK